MVTLTEAARAHLVQILDQIEAPSNMTIRFVPTDANQLIVYLDYIRSGDTTFVHDGKVVLVLDAQVAQALTQSVIDLQPRLNAEPRFVRRAGAQGRRPAPSTAQVTRDPVLTGETDRNPIRRHLVSGLSIASPRPPRHRVD